MSADRGATMREDAVNGRDSAQGAAPESSGAGGAEHGHGHPPSSVGPKATRAILSAFFLLCGALVVLDFLLDRQTEHPHPLESIPAFYTVYGLVGVGALIMAAKGLRRIVMRPEDYYDAD